MDNAIAQLRLALGDLLQYYPLVLRNDLCPSSAATATPLHDSPSSSPPADGPSLSLAKAAAPSHDRRQMAEAVEGFLTELTHALSLGLHDGDGFELWSVLELLECVPDRMQAEAQAAERHASATVSGTAAAAATTTRLPSSPSPSSSASRIRQPPSGPALSPPTSRTPVKAAGVSSSRAAAANTAQPSVAATTPTMRSDAPLWHHQLQRFRFASQLVYVVRTGFPSAPRPLQARILLRLALNQGCLLASLELLRRWCRTELEGFYDVTECAGALLVQPSSDSDTWHSFVAAIAPVAGPPMSEIAAGAPKTAAQSFQLQLVVAGLDDDPYASLDYYTQLHSYLKGRRGTRPSALACVEAAQLRRAREESEKAAAAAVALQRRSRAAPSGSSTAHDAQAGAEGEATAARATRRHTNTARVAAVVGQHAVLEVESLPVTHASAPPSTRADRGDQPDGGGVATASQSSKSTQRQRHRRKRRKPRRVPGEEQEGRKREEGEEEGETTGRSSAPSQHHRGAVGSGHNSSSSSSSLSSSFSLASAVASASRADSPGGQSGVPAAASPQGSCEETPLVEKKTKKEATEGVREAEESLRQPHQGSGGHEDSSTAPPAVLYDGRMHVSAERGVDKASDGGTESRAQESASPPHRSEANCTADANVTHADVALTADPLEFASSVSITDPEATAALSAESSSPPPVLRTLARSTQQQVPPPLPQYDTGNDDDDDRDGDGACHVMQYSKEAGAVEKKEAGDVAGSPSSLPCTPAELAQLQSRVLRCWAVAVAHAEARERKGMAARDADANCLNAVM